METLVQQNFNPPLKVKHKGEVVSIPTRNWTIGEANETSDHIENMGDMGLRQIEEVWKYYDKEIYVSNYGYVAEISEEEREKEFVKDFFNKEIDFEKGVIYRNLTDKQKDIMKERNFVPDDDKSAGYQICLYVREVNEPLHRIIAKTFLKQPEGKNIVHHIDNNSYNNHITNLVWLDDSEHTRAVHPLSYK